MRIMMSGRSNGDSITSSVSHTLLLLLMLSSSFLLLNYYRFGGPPFLMIIMSKYAHLWPLVIYSYISDCQ